MIRYLMLTTALSLGLVRGAAAEDLALVISNENYALAPDLRGARIDRYFARTLEDAGFRVFQGADLSGSDMQALASDFAAAAEAGRNNRLVAFVSGHFAHGAGNTWLLGTEAETPNVFSVGTQGLSIQALLDRLREAPRGQTVLILPDTRAEAETGAGLAAGRDAIDPPRGVALAEGRPVALLRFLRQGILVPGTTYEAAARDAGDGVEVTGDLPRGATLITASRAPEAMPRADTGDLAYWNAAVDIGTVDSLEAYLTRYPNGTFASEARRRIADLRETPAQRAEAAEAALSLSRDDRRRIQRDLTDLGYSTRGVDGIFGAGTRGAVQSWQTATGNTRTGYLTRAQITDIGRSADARRAARAAEERRRREAAEADDRGYWQRLGQGGYADAELDAYLARYPQGIFAADARQRLAAAEEEAEREDRRQQMRADWDRVTRADTVDGYQQFLNRYPRSRFADPAQARIAELRNAERANRSQDNQFWRNAALAGFAIAALEAYLDRYPGGDHADEARNRLSLAQDEARRDRQAAEDAARQAEREADARRRAEEDAAKEEEKRRDKLAKALEKAKKDDAKDAEKFWKDVRKADTPDAYRLYLNRFPDSPWSDAARARLADLAQGGQSPADKRDAYLDVEDDLLNEPSMRLMVEQRLQLQGYSPGLIDGHFDSHTRNALRQFQGAVGQEEATGYVTRTTLADLQRNER